MDSPPYYHYRNFIHHYWKQSCFRALISETCALSYKSPCDGQSCQDTISTAKHLTPKQAILSRALRAAAVDIYFECTINNLMRQIAYTTSYPTPANFVGIFGYALTMTIVKTKTLLYRHSASIM